MEALRSRVPLVAAVAAAAVWLGFVWLAPAGNGTLRVGQPPPAPDLAAPAPEVAPPPAAAPSPVPALPPPAASSLGEVVPGFDGTLVAQLGVWGRVDAAQWPSRRAEPVTLPMPREMSLSPDTAHRLFVRLAPAALEGRGARRHATRRCTCSPPTPRMRSGSRRCTRTPVRSCGCAGWQPPP